MDWRGSDRANRWICRRYSPGNSTQNFTGIYFINMYVLLFHLFQFQKGMNTKTLNSSSQIFSHLVLKSSATTPHHLHKPVGGLTTVGNLLGGCNLQIRTHFTIHLPQSSTGIIKANKISRLY